MTIINDKDYLCNHQYKDARNLNARIRLHDEFSTNKYGWFRWVFDQYDKPYHARVLELGCGTGDLWLENNDRIPDGWQITVSDFSAGMLDQAQKRLSGQGQTFNFALIDAQFIPYQDDYFDVVIANHFIYHVPHRAKAISEMRRVLKQNGRLYTTTIGMNHMKELPDLVARFDPENVKFMSNKEIPFTLENGSGQLEKYFSDVKMKRYADSLFVTDANILVDYALSGMRLGLNNDRRDELAHFIEQEMSANDGVFVIQKDSGIFVASK
jgi:ubiquinone/menaquinone biosynthesis C-methylase UbiE